MAIQVKLKIVESIILLTYFFNVENWKNILKKEMKNIEQLYEKLIYLSSLTLCSGVLEETGSLPCQEIIKYKKLMFYYYIWISDKERLVKRIMTCKLKQNLKTAGMLN